MCAVGDCSFFVCVYRCWVGGGGCFCCGGGDMKGSGVTKGHAVLLGRESEQAARQTSSAGVER